MEFHMFILLLSLLCSCNSIDKIPSRFARGAGGAGGRDKQKIKIVNDGDKGMQLNDTEWLAGKQWYLDKTVQGKFPTMNIRTAWEECVTGSGIVVAILDDGIYYNNPDIQNNYESAISYDVLENTNDTIPTSLLLSSDHGTRSAGIIAASTNEFCGVGVAFEARIAGEIIFGKSEMTDEMEAAAFTKTLDYVDIYSNTRGPTAGSAGTRAVGPRMTEALQKATQQGRKGLGSVVVWASGNNGPSASCAYDGNMNSLYTIPISGITRKGKILDTGEKCSAIMATAISKNPGSHETIVTVTRESGCTDDFGESSAAASFASGIIALTLQANPQLTWRDVQHLIVETSNTETVRFDPMDFITNKAGKKVSQSFGFGLLDAGRMVKLAKVWKPISSQSSCTVRPGNWKPLPLSDQIQLDITADTCDGEKEIHFVEHVAVHLNLSSCGQDKLVARLYSPANTLSVILPGQEGFAEKDLQWTVLSVQFWGEDIIGGWRLEFNDCPGLLNNWHITFYGTKTNPLSDQQISQMNNKETVCPYKSPLKTSGELDLMPLYIFIVLISIVIIGFLVYVLYKKCWRSKSKSFCGRQKFIKVRQTSETTHGLL